MVMKGLPGECREQRQRVGKGWEWKVSGCFLALSQFLTVLECKIVSAFDSNLHNTRWQKLEKEWKNNWRSTHGSQEWLLLVGAGAVVAFT
ncbi:hypothetical protein Cni_G24301 [Canna indica]|uniref:Uncharacterized protein n=1 Tax=Canna indica TaxID=4628 RepID=A0AAQ3KVQ1_9LILI|nr:hypothetical protein Cni_G24301 [Canna indica]